MCGRYTFFAKKENIEFKIKNINSFDFKEDYNISPGREIRGIIKKGNNYYLQKFIWGMLPNKNNFNNNFNKSSSKYFIINSRKESLLDIYYDSFKNFRCVILASGFYEWRIEGSKKTPYYFKFNNNKIIYFAGIYKIREDGFPTCSIITVESNDKIKNIHDRIPAILDYNHAKIWLDENNDDILLNILKPVNNLEFYEVNRNVGNTVFNSVETILPFKNDYKLFE
ncbi:SOS response-associated peptidase [Marinitoga sp. 38H-ov]|uniref:SOS response-associated peptidase n=1 Tax=Marinitoga sp. 38H-ov TaxID=1755814 RepID=UPI0013EA864B|nr:SOS response-associated peptidase [Marinitoga sp. 38H-ov]KAF2956915.1 hypothetical protein AS160_02710 [Marinitoga sp. 38H-ov]